MPALNDLVAEVAASATVEDPEAQVPHKRVRGVGCLGPTYVNLRKERDDVHRSRERGLGRVKTMRRKPQ
jgi:hypothetical protein